MSDRCRCGQPKNSTHVCDYKDLQIANLKDAISASQAREAELQEKLAAHYAQRQRLQRLLVEMRYDEACEFFNNKDGEAELRKLLESKTLLGRVKLCSSCGFRPNCPTGDDEGGLCDDYIAQPKEPKQ